MGALLTAAGAAAAAVAERRRARPLHPRGTSFSGYLRTMGSVDSGVPLLDRPGRHPALIRLSKATPTPAGWPDVFGLAVRVDVDGAPFDLLLSTALGRVPVLRHVFSPRAGADTFYGSLTGYATERGRLYFGAWAGLGGPDTIALAVATRLGRWRPVGVLTLRTPLPAGTDAALAFDPQLHDLPDLRADSRLNHLRGVVYRAAQRRRLGAAHRPRSV